MGVPTVPGQCLAMRRSGGLTALAAKVQYTMYMVLLLRPWGISDEQQGSERGFAQGGVLASQGFPRTDKSHDAEVQQNRGLG